ncbi:MAG: NADP-dependent 3-hydroxy acid dehydrogenase YdfG [Candidatus Paceibacteria bacterium]
MLAQEGVHVVLAARRRERLDLLAAELGGAVTVAETGIADASQVRALFTLVRERFHGIDLLLNNAGIGISRFGAITKRYCTAKLGKTTVSVLQPDV